MSQSYEGSGRVYAAAQRIQGKWRWQRNRRTITARRLVVPRRIPRQFRANGIKDFVFTYQPFNMTMTHGAGSGLNFYAQGVVPSPPATAAAGARDFQMNFSLDRIETLIAGGGGAANGGFSPNLNVAEYTALFDCYRIKKIEIQMLYNSNDQVQSITTGLPNIMLAKDYDDSNSTSSATLCQYDNFKVWQMGSAPQNSRTMTIYPKLQSAIETGGGAVLAMHPAKGAWIDTLAPTAKYFGLKGFADIQVTGGALTNIGFITFYVKCYVQFKNTK